MEYVLTVTEEELSILGAALNELPRKVSQPVFIRIQAQVDEQNKAHLAAVEATAKAEATRGQLTNAAKELLPGDA